MSFDELVSKLKSSHEEIRQRAIVNIADKLKYGVIDVNKLVDESDCCSSLVSLFSERLDMDVDIVAKSVLPNVGKICDILANILEVSINGRKVLESLNAKQILSRWQQKYEPFQTFAVKESVNELLALLNVDENESSESQLVSTYGIDSLKTISSVNNDQSQDPFEFINQRNLSLPPRLLAGSKEKRTYSPVTRSYIKRVTFSNDSTDPGMYSQASVFKKVVNCNYILLGSYYKTSTYKC